MSVFIEKKRGIIHKKVCSDINRLVTKFNRTNKEKLDRYLKALKSKNISIEKKKAVLMKRLHELITKTFSINLKKANKEAIVSTVKKHLPVLREMVDKLGELNYYLESVFLEEIGFTKKRIIKDLSKKDLNKIIKQESLDKKELERLELTVYKLINDIISLDNRLLRNFRKKEEKVFEERKTETKDIEKILKKESEILCHMEAKLPPESKINKSILKSPKFDYWSATVISLLISLEHEYEKEKEILTKLKKNSKIRKKIDIKITDIEKEKRTALKLKEDKLAVAEKLGNLEKEWQKAGHNWAASSRL